MAHFLNNGLSCVWVYITSLPVIRSYIVPCRTPTLSLATTIVGGLVVFRIVTSTEVQKNEVKLFYHGTRTGFKKEKGRGEEKTPLVERKVYLVLYKY